MAKKFVFKLELLEGNDKRRAMKAVSSLPGIDEIAIDVKAKKLTVVGTVDPISLVSKLRKRNWPTELISVGPAKEPEKKEEAKKEEPKKEEPAKEEAKKEEPKKEEGKKEEPKKEEEKKPEPAELVALAGMQYRPYYNRPYYAPPMNTYYQPHHSIEENPNACVIF